MFDNIRKTLRGNQTAEWVGYGMIVGGLAAALGPWILVSVAGMILLNEFVDG